MKQETRLTLVLLLNLAMIGGLVVVTLPQTSIQF